MKFVGSVFASMLVVFAMGAAVSIRRYAQPAPLFSVQIASANASSLARAHARSLTAACQGVSFYPHHLIRIVSESFPGLKKITVRKNSSGFLVTVLQQKPLCLINQTQVLTQDGQYVDKDQFDPTLIATLFAYNAVDPLPDNVHHHLKFARSFDTDVIRDYSIVWHDFSRIELRDKQDPLLKIIVSADTPLSEELFKAYGEVKKELKTFPAGKRGRAWQVDMRFKNQILVC